MLQSRDIPGDKISDLMVVTNIKTIKFTIPNIKRRDSRNYWK